MGFCTFVGKSVEHTAWVCFWVPYFVPSIYVFMPLPISQSWLLQLYNQFWNQEERFLPLSFLFSKLFLSALGPLSLHVSFRIILFISKRTLAVLFFIVIELKQFINLEELASLLWWVFQSINAVCLSLYLDILWFISIM